MPLGVTARPGRIGKAVARNEVAQRVDELQRTAEASPRRRPARSCTGTSGFWPLFAWKRSSSNQRMMKPNRLTLKLFSSAVASNAGCLGRV